MKNGNHGTTPPRSGSAPYRFHGMFYEACDCFTVCPCWTGGAPDEGECTGIVAWDIEAGTIDGVDVAGCRVASVSQHAGHRDRGHQQVILFVDSAATAEQAEALIAALSGGLGGPLGELSELLGELIGVERVEIVLQRQGRSTTLTVGRRLQVEGTATAGPTGETMALSDGRLTMVLGSPAEIGVSRRFRVGLPAQAIDLDLRGRSTMGGSFSYDFAP